MNKGPIFPFITASPRLPPIETMSTEEPQTLHVKSHSNIGKTVTKCLSLLTAKPDPTNSSPQPRILELQADAKLAGKAITITEIVKRRLKEAGRDVTQMTSVREMPSAVAGEEKGNHVVRKHLQGEGYGKEKKKKPDVQIVIRLEMDGEAGG
jgi:hypothetical protein